MAGIVGFLLERKFIAIGHSRASRYIAAKEHWLREHGVQSERAAERAAHEYPPRRIHPVVGLDKRQQFLFEEGKELGRIARTGEVRIGDRRIVHGPQRLVVCGLSGICDADDDYFRYEAIVVKTAVDRIQQLEIPLSIEHIEYGIRLRLVKGV